MTRQDLVEEALINMSDEEYELFLFDVATGYSN